MIIENKTIKDQSTHICLCASTWHDNLHCMYFVLYDFILSPGWEADKHTKIYWKRADTHAHTNSQAHSIIHYHSFKLKLTAASFLLTPAPIFPPGMLPPPWFSLGYRPILVPQFIRISSSVPSARHLRGVTLYLSHYPVAVAKLFSWPKMHSFHALTIYSGFRLIRIRIKGIFG